jgi:hypothetical protein
MTASHHIARLTAIVAACPLLAIHSPALSQTDDAANLPLFDEAAPLRLTLEAPLRALRRDSRSRPERDGFIRYVNPAGDQVTLDVEVRVRGNNRLAECDFPPLRLDFRRGQLEGTVFAGQNRLKLVTLCKSRDAYRDYLQLEYDIYRLFNTLTNYSFRVRPVQVEYVSTDSRREEVMTEPAFLIEEDWEVAARHGLNVIEQESIPLESLDAAHTALLSVFQFMIGNTDWSALRGPDEENCCHNGKVIGGPDTARIVLPYDFDQAGLIYTEYSQPNERLPIRTVRQRLYRGFCAFHAETGTAIALILERREQLESVLQTSAAGEKSKADALEYLRESMAILADTASRTEEILESCRG